jgi:hypothetical protein
MNCRLYMHHAIVTSPQSTNQTTYRISNGNWKRKRGSALRWIGYLGGRRCPCFRCLHSINGSGTTTCNYKRGRCSGYILNAINGTIWEVGNLVTNWSRFPWFLRPGAEIPVRWESCYQLIKIPVILEARSRDSIGCRQSLLRYMRLQM